MKVRYWEKTEKDEKLGRQRQHINNEENKIAG